MKQEFEDDYLNTLAWLKPGNLQKAIREAKNLVKAALDGGHLNWPIVDVYLAMYNETIMETER